MRGDAAVANDVNRSVVETTTKTVVDNDVERLCTGHDILEILSLFFRHCDVDRLNVCSQSG